MYDLEFFYNKTSILFVDLLQIKRLTIKIIYVKNKF